MAAFPKISAAVAAAAIATSLWAQSGALNPLLPDLAPASVPATPADATDVIAMGKNVDERMTVSVDVGGHGHFPFLVDTGAERTIISNELARRLNLEAGPTVVIHSMTEKGRVATRHITHLQVSKSRIENVNAPALPAANIGAAGMLGIDSLNSRRVVFDFNRKIMSVAPSRAREDWGPDVIVVNGKSLYGRLMLVDAKIDGERIWAIIDTGSEITIGNRVLRDRLAARRKLRATVPVEIVSVTGGTITADYTVVKQVTLGGVLIENMPIGFADVHPFRQLKLTDRPAILLGMDALRLFDRVSIDFPRKQVRFLGPESGALDVRTVLRELKATGRI